MKNLKVGRVLIYSEVLPQGTTLELILTLDELKTLVDAFMETPTAKKATQLRRKLKWLRGEVLKEKKK